MFRVTVQDRLLRAKLQRMYMGIGEDGETAVKNASTAGMREAVQKAPRDTGALKRSIQLKPIEKTSTGIIGGFDANIKYAAPQNYGFVHNRSGKFIEGKFFMEKGYQVSLDRLDKEVAKAIKKFLQR